MFSCLPVSNAHECCIAYHFIGRYNERNGTAYRVVAFPEIDNRNTKEPEVLLADPRGGPPLAIERKSVVYPLDEHYLGKHRNGHYFLDLFVEQLKLHGRDFSDSLYQVVVHERDLNDRRQKEIPQIAEQVAAAVVRNWSRTDESFDGIGRRTPIPWRFRIVQPEERDYDDPEHGIGIIVNLESSLLESPEKIEELRQGYATEFKNQAERATEKFVGYPECRKLLLVQFFGEFFSGVGDREIRKILRSASLPEVIDEVWVARQEWVELDESEIRWELAR